MALIFELSSVLNNAVTSTHTPSAIPTGSDLSFKAKPARVAGMW